jgi:hypothetical protein
MSNKPIYHYVYRITNIIERKHYYGKRSSRIEPKLDLGGKYFSSSRDKVFKKDQKENPQNYKYKIIRCFESSPEAIEFEIRLHEKFDVGVNKSFYNRAKQTSSKFDTTGVGKTEEQKMSISGHKHHQAIPIDIYNYYTGEIIAENVISNVWCRDNGYSRDALSMTLLSDIDKPHNTNKKSKNYNYCHVSGVYAVRHGDEPKKFNKEHIEETKLGNFTFIDVYDYYTGELIAEKVISKTWCRSTGYSHSALNATLNSDPSKPHCSNYKSPNFNSCHTKGIYVVLHGHESKNFVKEHIEETKLINGLPIDIYNYYTGELIAEKVISATWCKENGYSSGSLNVTLKSDSSNPHCSTFKSPNFNSCHVNGIYAVRHGDDPRNFSKEHIENAKLNNGIPIDVYNYYTGELITENVISSRWCRENGYDSGELNETLKSDSSKPHYASSKKLPNYNPCHHKGIYAVKYGDGPKNFSKEHIKSAEFGNAVSIDIYNYYTDELIVENTISSVWCRNNGYSSCSLNDTLRSDRSKPHNSYKKSPNYNPCHTKGIYAKLHNPK